MGNITTVKILNDYAGNIERSGPVLIETLCMMLRTGKT